MACLYCDADLKRTDKNLISCAICDLKFHAKCTKLTNKNIKVIMENPCIKYVCKHCEHFKYSNQINDLKTKVEECFNIIMDQNEKIDNLIQSSNKMETSEQKKSFSSVVANKNKQELIILKPVDEEQTNNN